MAMGLLRGRVRSSTDTWRVESAGVWAEYGYPAAENTQVVLRQRGIDLSSHRSCPITPEMVEAFNLILTMEKNHKQALWAAFPQYMDHVHLFWEMAGEQHDVVDPIGRSLADFEDTAQEMERILSTGFDEILTLGKGLV
jgi:protein-tyrosine-phosphatase